MDGHKDTPIPPTRDLQPNRGESPRACQESTANPLDSLVSEEIAIDVSGPESVDVPIDVSADATVALAGGNTLPQEEAPRHKEADTGSILSELLLSCVKEEGDRLTFGSVIATGGVGKIGLVRDNSLGRQMAVKVLKTKSMGEPLIVRGFLREAQVTAQLEHPNIVPIHELGAIQERPYFTMSLVEGTTLKKWMKETTHIDYDRLMDFLEVMIKVCDALDFAHNRGVIHCDLKPANIMVGAFGQVYLMDWGGAQLLPECPDGCNWVRDSLPPVSSQGRVFGTPAYMAPERAAGKVATVRSDIFALGAIIYELLTGSPPFRADDVTRAMQMSLHCEHQPIEEHAKGGLIPRELIRIVHKAMAKSPADRHASAAELRADLVRVFRGGTSFPTVDVTKGTDVIREGDSGDAAYIVASGQLEVYKTVNGERVSLRVLREGDVFGEMAIFADSSRTASVVALTDAKLVTITEEVIRNELDSMKPWMASFVRTLARRFSEREEKTLEASVEKACKPRSRSWWDLT